MSESTNQDLKNKFESLKEELECAHKEIEHLQDVNGGLSLEIEAYKGKVQGFEYCFKCLSGKER